MIRSNRPPAWVEDRLDAVETALLAAEDDRRRLTEAVEQLDPDRSSRELKDALRANHRRPGTIADERVALLRRRYDTVHQLLDRRDHLERRIDSSVVDLELLAVRSVELAATSGDRWGLDDELDRLRIDLDALEQARAEIEHL